MHVRLAAPADAAAILELMTEFNREEAIVFARDAGARALAPLLADDSIGRVLWAEHDGAPAGYALVTWSYDIEYGGRDGWLTELYLVPALRGHGHARALLDEAVAAARRHGVHTLHLQVRPENGAARGLYQRAGFTAWTRLGYSKKL